MPIAAIDLELDSASGNSLLAGQNNQRLQDDVDALIVDKLAEEAEAIDQTAALAPIEIGRGIRLPVRDHDAFLARKAPVEIAIGEKFRGKNEMVAFLQHRLQTACAQRHKLGPQLRKTFIAR